MTSLLRNWMQTSATHTALRFLPRHSLVYTHTCIASRSSLVLRLPSRSYASKNTTKSSTSSSPHSVPDAPSRIFRPLALPVHFLSQLHPAVIRQRTRDWWSGWRTRGWWWHRFKQSALLIAHALNIFFLIHLIFAHVGRLSATYGPSMLPTFATDGEVVLEDRFSYRHLNAPLVRGDLIVVESPVIRGHMVCKRLIGLPGDVVCVDPTGLLAPSTEHVTIPKGHVWISGDNAEWSRDSREYGPVPIALVKGRIVARVWPPHKFTIYPSGSGVNFLT